MIKISKIEEITQRINNVPSDHYLIVKFFSKFCPPCLKLETELNKLRNLSQLRTKIEIIALDVEKYPEVARSNFFSVNFIPCLFIFKNRKLHEKVEGYVSFFDLEKILN